ncbi:hypothetical protein PybrP1_006906 [[Pythium] brassicae (nom. inval.)]|nr:hypothetical protein PybrP1_006906 [[Pythium] brassicae (nom. inval.)]
MNAAAKLADAILGKREVAEGSTQPAVSSPGTMKAIVWEGPKRVACVDKPIPVVTHEKDVIVMVTACSVCSGSDSHLYSGEIPTMDEGCILGHEACGVIAEVGSDVKRLKKGDRAEFVRVPFGEVNCFRIPDDVPDDRALFVSDVLSTSLHAVEIGEVTVGDSVVIWGLGPIGLYAAAWCKLKGARRVLGIDKVAERLELAHDKFGIEVLDRGDLSSSQVVSKVSGLFPRDEGVDVVIDATGFRFSETLTSKLERAVGLETDTPDILNECVSVVRSFGRVSVIADYVGYANHFPLGHIVMKHLTLRSGQCPVQKYFDVVMKALQQQQIDPTLMVTHRLTLDQAPKAYEELFYKASGYVKVLITPGGVLDKNEEGKRGEDAVATCAQP